jgi:hypothetical protein
MKRLIATVVAAPLFLLLQTSWTSSPDKPIELHFIDHLTGGMIEQDVFVEKSPGSGIVSRVLPDEKHTYENSPLFTTAEAQPHNPFNPHAAGPFRKGLPLNMTLNEWLRASGTAEYQCEGGWGTLTARFTHLVPNAVYTIWHFFMPAPVTEPFTGTLDIPLGERDGSQSVFVTDAAGNAKLDIRFERCLQLGENQLVSGLAIAYHSDQKTYDSDPGPFGEATHVHLFAMLPNQKDQAALK